MDNFEGFTNKLVDFFREELNASDETCREIEECEDFYDVRVFFEESKELKELLRFDDLESQVDDLEDEVEDLETEIKYLKMEISELEDKLESTAFKPVTYWDEEKYELFLKYHEKVTPSELESFFTKQV